jgi:hypothetical protein
MPPILSLYKDGVLRFISSITAKNSRAKGLPEDNACWQGCISFLCMDGIYQVSRWKFLTSHGTRVADYRAQGDAGRNPQDKGLRNSPSTEMV